MSVTWTATEPTVDEWSAEQITPEYHYYASGKGSWYSRIKFSIGRISGTRDIAVRAIAQGIKASGWTAQPANATPIVEVNGVEYEGPYCGGWNVNTTDWNAGAAQLGTNYAIISGAANGASIPCKNKPGGEVTLTNPITAPAFHIKVSGVWTDAESVYVNTSGVWTEVSAAYAKDGTWKELQ